MFTSPNRRIPDAQVADECMRQVMKTHYEMPAGYHAARIELQQRHGDNPEHYRQEMAKRGSGHFK